LEVSIRMPSEICCYRIVGTIKSETSIHTGDGTHIGVAKQTKPYVEGTVIRGATGLAIIRIAPDDLKLRAIFDKNDNHSSPVIFRNAYPYHHGCAEHGAYQPAPRTLHICESCDERYDSFEPPLDCNKCGAPVKPYTGWICSGCQHIIKRPIQILHVTSTPVDRVTQSAAIIRPPTDDGEPYGTLHTTNVIPAGEKFAMEIILSRDMGAYLDKFLNIVEKAVPDEGIGAGKSRGLGKVEIKLDRTEVIDRSHLEKRAKSISAEHFSLILRSDLVLEKDSLPAKSLSAAARRAYTWMLHEDAPSLPEIKELRSLYSQSIASGWSLKEGKRRNARSSIKAGATFEFQSSEHDKLALALAALEFHAIGSYKPHGKGQVTVHSYSPPR